MNPSPCYAAFLAAMFAVPSSSGAQQYLVVPAGYDARDALGRAEFAGSCAHQRQQILIDASHLAPMAGRSITSVWVRRDAGYKWELDPASGDLSVWMSVTSRDPDRPSPQLARNRGPAPRLVFQGALSFPRSPAGSVSWSPSNAVEIPLSPPFVYPGGNLCLEILGVTRDETNCFWPVDALVSGPPGSVDHVGQACGKFAAATASSTAYADQGTLRIGSTAVFRSWGQPDTIGLMFIASSLLASPVRLDPLGAPGCRVYVEPAIKINAPFTASPFGPGFAQADVQLPVDPAFAGASLYTQWANVEVTLPFSEWSNPIGLTTSNAVRATLSSRPPDAGISVVATPPVLPNDPLPSWAETNVSVAPILRFDHR